MPPADRRILPPEISVEIAKSDCVTSRAQPPFWMRLCAVLNDDQYNGMPLTSEAGGFWIDGNWFASAGLCGPGSVRSCGLRALIAPSPGPSGLPNDAAFAVTATPAAIAA